MPEIIDPLDTNRDLAERETRVVSADQGQPQLQVFRERHRKKHPPLGLFQVIRSARAAEGVQGQELEESERILRGQLDAAKPLERGPIERRIVDVLRARSDHSRVAEDLSHKVWSEPANMQRVLGDVVILMEAVEAEMKGFIKSLTDTYDEKGWGKPAVEMLKKSSAYYLALQDFLVRHVEPVASGIQNNINGGTSLYGDPCHLLCGKGWRQVELPTK